MTDALLTAGPPAWPGWMMRSIALAASLLLVRNAAYGLRGRPLVVPAGRAPESGTRVVTGWWARVFGLLALCVAAGLLLVAAVGLGPGCPGRRRAARVRPHEALRTS